MERGDIEQSFTKACQTPCGELFVTCSHRDFKPVEIFVITRELNKDRQKNCDWALNAIAMAISNLLQLDTPIEKIGKYSDNFHCPAYSELGLITCPVHIKTILINPKAIIDA